MSKPISLPTPEQVIERMRLCREEMTALRKLHRAIVTARRADEVRHKRASVERQEAAHAD